MTERRTLASQTRRHHVLALALTDDRRTTVYADHGVKSAPMATMMIVVLFRRAARG